MSAVENFPVLLSEAEEESSAVPPCFSHEGINVRVLLLPRTVATNSVKVAADDAVLFDSTYISVTAICTCSL